MLDHMLEDRVTLVKKDGTVSHEEVPCLVTKGKVQIHNVTLPIEIDDHLLRKLPNGLVEDYIVIDPVLHRGLGEGFFIVDVRRNDARSVQKQAAIASIINNFHGDNSRVNINSTDNSSNFSGRMDITKLQSLIDQIKPAIGLLPQPQQQAIATPLAVLDDEIRSGSPSPSKVSAALHSLKTVAEGAAGNIVASGIIALISSILVAH